MPTGPRTRLAILCGALLGALAQAVPAAGQLRPLDPMDWRAFDPGTTLLVRLGGGILLGEHASIGQINGRLIEAPAVILSWTTGVDRRLVLRAIVQPLRIYHVESSLGTPLPGTTELTPHIVDAGDNQVETVLRLAPAATTAGSLAALRWGVRLPTHDDEEGLDRHKTDWYATLGGRLVGGSLTLAGEAGLGVFGTREEGHDKALPFLYDASLRWRRGLLEPSLTVVGQAMSRPIRGNEDLAELRGAVRVGRRRWLEGTLVRGLAYYGPRWGVLLFAGLAVP